MDVDVGALVERLGTGERRPLARLLSCVEDGDTALLRRIVAALYPLAGGARVLGVTGPPGVGKSTLTSALAGSLRRRGRTVGIVAVDPSSPLSGGALLGDRVRMQSHHDDPGVFVRSMAARGHLGGIAVATPHAILVLDAAGFDDVVVETVGVGQAEIEVASAADTTVVVLAPGMGDAIQAAKAGILEVADVFVVNKADHDGVSRLVSELRGMLDLGRQVDGERSWTPPVVTTVATDGEGIDDLVEAVEAHHAHLAGSGELDRRRLGRARDTVREIALEGLRERLGDLDVGGAPLLDRLAAAVARRELDPYAAADELLGALEG